MEPTLKLRLEIESGSNTGMPAALNPHLNRCGAVAKKLVMIATMSACAKLLATL